MSEFLGKKDFLGMRSELKTEIVELKDKGKVCLMELSGEDRDLLEEMIFVAGKRDLSNFRGKVLALSIVDPKTKEKIFRPEEHAKIGSLPGWVTLKLYSVAQKLSGIGEEEVNKMVKNSETSGQTDDSPSG